MGPDTEKPRQDAPYLAYADESSWNTGRFRSIALATLQSTDAEDLRNELVALLDESNVQEFKWQKLKKAKYRFPAKKLVDFTFKYSDTKQLRLDVLTWDTHDSRHEIIGRDDNANLGRMYYHLFRSVLTRRWPEGACWYLYPDEHTSLDWPAIRQCLEYKGIQFDLAGEQQQSWFRLEGMKELFNIHDLCECRSHEEPFIQLADLFSGLAAYSYESYEKWCSWRDDSQMCLPGFGEAVKMSNADWERCCILNYLNKKCKARRLGVALNSEKGLFSHNPDQSPNFWRYEPQHELDRAPTKFSE